MALDESTDNLDKLESNGIAAYIDPRLNELLQKYGDISIDYIRNPGGEGFTIGMTGGSCSDSTCGC